MAPHRSAPGPRRGQPFSSSQGLANGLRMPPLLTHGVAYDEAIHVANRNRALGRLNQPIKRAA